MGSIFLAIGRASVTENFYVTSMPPTDHAAIGKAYMRYPDGSGINTAVALSKLGVRSCVAAKVGDDNYGDVITSFCSASGIFSSYVLKSSTVQTGVSAVITENLGVRRRIILEGANKTLSETDIEYAFAGKPDYVLVNGDIPDNALKCALLTASETSTRTLLNMFGEFSLGIELETLCPVEILVIDSLNAKRRTDLSPGDSATNMKICSLLSQQITAKYYVLRCPDGSVFAYSGTYYYVIPPYDLEPVDRTGCDEMFGAALFLMYLLKNSIKNACEFASLAEVITSQRPGGTSSYPTFDDIRKFIKKNSLNGDKFD